MASRIGSPSDAERSSLLSQSPSNQISNRNRRIVYVVSFAFFTAMAVGGAAEMGWSCKVLGNNQCTILSATALSVGILGLMTMGWIRNNYPSCSGFSKGSYLNP